MKMAIKTTLSLQLLLAFVPSSQSEEWSPGCEIWPRDIPTEHGDWACNKSNQNHPDALNWLADTYNPQVVLGIPEEKTFLCPTENVLTVDDLPTPGGHKTRWIVHNAASNPVVLSWVNHQGIEVSAADFKTQPPVSHSGHWPNGSILVPGYVAIVNGSQGHTLLAREMLEDESGGGNNTGRILLKHRMGLIYIRNDRGAGCPEDPMNDPAPSIDAPSGDETKNKIRSPENPNPQCNFLNKGFINKVGCGIDVYFATGGNYTLTPSSFPKGQNPPQCENFSMHLGVNPRPTNYQEDHSSPIKFEVTYATHRFVARMSHDNSLVAEIFIDSDIIHDCPDPAIEFSISTEKNIGLNVLTNGDFVVDTNAVPHDSADMFRVANVTEASIFGRLLTNDASKLNILMNNTISPTEMDS